jgi:hypothetical protein
VLLRLQGKKPSKITGDHFGSIILKGAIHRWYELVSFHGVPQTRLHP